MAERKVEGVDRKRGSVFGLLWLIVAIAGLAFAYFAYTGWLRATCIEKATQSYSTGEREGGRLNLPARSGEKLNEDLYQQCMGTFK